MCILGADARRHLNRAAPHACFVCVAQAASTGCTTTKVALFFFKVGGCASRKWPLCYAGDATINSVWVRCLHRVTVERGTRWRVVCFVPACTHTRSRYGAKTNRLHASARTSARARRTPPCAPCAAHRGPRCARNAAPRHHDAAPRPGQPPCWCATTGPALARRQCCRRRRPSRRTS